MASIPRDKEIEPRTHRDTERTLCISVSSLSPWFKMLMGKHKQLFRPLRLNNRNLKAIAVLLPPEKS